MRKLVAPIYVVTLILLSGCHTVSTHPGSNAPQGEVAKPAAGATRYAVDAEHSEVRFLVYKTGALSAWGHDHTVDAHGFKGEVYLASSFADSSFALTLPVKDFQVDDPASRAVEGPDFASKPSASDIQGTTANMLGPHTLDAAKYAEVTIQSVKVTGSEAKAEATVRITLHGTARDLKVPFTVKPSGDELTASGEFELRQSEFGITPFSAVGGALQVADVIKVKFKILARKSTS
ncbi:MAG TPA: YceI family protein [Gammaproteobacteria bacterium]|nr:YceI family protein [Gammaproteobacteria bacterium]